MNYEEMLNAKESNSGRTGRMPFGTLRKMQIEGKYHHVLELHDDLVGRPGFMDALKAEEKSTSMLKSRQQLHFLEAEHNGVLMLELEQGQFQTLDQVLSDNPAIVAKSGFIDQVIDGLFDITEELHQKSLYHLCFSPQNVLLRKGDEMPMLLLHASTFSRSVAMSKLFLNMEEFVAPEVLEGQEPTNASDVYSLGKLIEWFYRHSDITYEYKRIVKKAVQQDPAKRYSSIQEMRSALKTLRSTKRSAISLIAAIAVALLCVFLYFELVPQADSIEFLEGAPTEPEMSLLDDGSFDPESDSDVWSDSDSVEIDTLGERMAMEAYMQKAEDIFRKRFTKEADQILSRVYNNENMNANEKTFMANTNAMRDDLVKLQTDLTEQTGITSDKASRIAMEVIDQLTLEKQRKLSTPTMGSRSND